MLITQKIDALLGGVSEATESLRDPSHAQEQVNLVPHTKQGLRKRFPTEHVAKLTASIVGYDSAFDYSINRSSTEKYRVVIVNGDLKVYNAITGVELTVLFPNGKAYLVGQGTDFRAALTGDSVVIANRTFVGAKDVTKKAADSTPEALLIVKLGDYSVNYSVTLDGHTVSYLTPQPGANNAKQAIGTDQIASSLFVALINTASLSNYTFLLFGNAIHVQRTNNSDFQISVLDGLGGTALKVAKESVQLFTDLPAVAKQGMIVKVVGSPETSADDYYVQYTESNTPGQHGVWKEVIAPGALTDVLPSTMPHKLVFDGAILEDQAQHGPVVLPVVSQSGATQTWLQGWQFKNAVAISESGEYTTHLHNDAFFTVLAGTNGTPRTITVGYDVDSSSLSATDSVTITVLLETGSGTGVFVSVGSATYATSGSYVDQTIQFTASPVAGARLKLVYSYGSGSTPGLPDVAYLTVHGSLSPVTGVLIQKGLGSTLTFNVAEFYPAGTSLTVTLDGNNFIYSIGATDQNGAAVASGIAALVNPNVTYDAVTPSSGVVLFTQGSGVPPVTSITSNYNPSLTFWSVGLALVAGANVGAIIKNLTDGSQGTVTANTQSTITTVLTGGADNAFEKGDLCTLVGTGTYFVFREARWTPRAVGDDVSNPFPAFMDATVDDVFFDENRLGFTIGENVCLSCSGDLFNFFRTTVTDLLVSDVISVKPPARKVRRFDNAVVWHDGVYLFTEAGEFFRLSGQPIIGPTTARIDVMGSYPTHRNVRPVVTGNHLLLCSARDSATHVALAERVTSNSGESSVIVHDITEHVVSYIRGNPIAAVIDDEAQIIFIVTDGVTDGFVGSIYVCYYTISDGSLAQLAWSRWDFSLGSIVRGASFLDGILSIVVQHGDGIHLESITLVPKLLPDVLLGDGTAFGDGMWLGSGVRA